MIVHYQPVIDLRTGSVVKAEALSRWPSSPPHLSAPADFIPYAERMGLIRNLTDWLLLRALEDWKAWNAPEIDLSINLSLVNLEEPDIVERVLSALERTATPSSILWLEVGESVLSMPQGPWIAAMERLAQGGIRFSIDGFGSRMSAVSHLELGRLPVREVKIDPAYSSSMDGEVKHRALVRSIIDLAATMRIAVVAKGVEDQQTADRLTRAGCSLAQGYFFGRPMEMPGFVEWLAASKAGRASLEPPRAS